jgi:hypothetical protein
MNIAKRGVDLDTRCAVCHRLFVDGGHRFITYKFVKQRWRALLLEDIRLKFIPCSPALEMLGLSFAKNRTTTENLSALELVV